MLKSKTATRHLTLELPLVCLIAFAPVLKASPVFFIDTPAILRAALQETLEKYPDLTKDDFVVEHDAVRFSCNADGKRYRAEEAATQCLKEPFAASPCQADVRLILKKTATESVIAREGGLCERTAEYKAVKIRFFEDGHIDTDRHDITLRESETALCSDKGLFTDLSELIAEHELALEQEFGSTGQLHEASP
ncbi:hypothetical protein [Microbulbifer sp. ALW1]|uniref:hypothetical protein n=1 Tax=Microbulbifer sp. (strain ALW1) TaxID=1516059 RepID=UPI00135C2772|nr:hypothetical protein [Microbulbifer sp. ALW1]